MELTDTNCSWGLTLSFEEFHLKKSLLKSCVVFNTRMRYTLPCVVWMLIKAQLMKISCVKTAYRFVQFKSGGHSELVPLLPIPNRTVKRLSADDSADSRVKVGHRQASIAKDHPGWLISTGVCLSCKKLGFYPAMLGRLFVMFLVCVLLEVLQTKSFEINLTRP